MYTLDSIKFQTIYSANGNVTKTKTIRNIIAALGKVRGTMTAEDVAYVFNGKVYSDEQITEKQAAAVLNELTRTTERGEFYHGMRGLYNIGGGFYEYK